MPDFRIYNKSLLEWNRTTVGRIVNYWNEYIVNPINPPGPAVGGDLFGDSSDADEERRRMLQPAIVIENLNANRSPEQNRLMEIAGIQNRYFSVKSLSSNDVEVNISNIQLTQ